MKLKLLAQALVAAAGIGVGSAQAGLIGDTIDYEVVWSGFPVVVSTNLPLSGSFVVGAGVELAAQPVNYTFSSGGFNHTLSGSVSVDVGDSSISVSFSGTAQPGAFIFNFTGIDDTILGMTVTGTGQMEGVNMFNVPSFDANSVSNMGYFLFGFQPGTSITQTALLELQANGNVPEPATLALVGIGLAGLAFRRRKRAPSQHCG